MALPTWWDDLLEIQSIDNLIVQEQKLLAAQQARAQALQDQGKERQEQLANQQAQINALKQAMQNLELTIDGQSKRLQILKNNLTRITTAQQLQAAENELATLQPALTQNEDLLLEQLSHLEDLQQAAADSTNFLQGLAQSSAAIQLEIAQAQQNAAAKIQSWQQRIDQLLNNLAPNVQHLFRPIYERCRFQKPISFLKDEHCYYCAYTLGREQVAQINRGEIAEVCLNCGRLLAPEAHNVLARHQISPEA
ncbi:MAG: hypothetical protein J6Y94_03395 [Bacteriovoracaceae bacterium]|nr:hypothetical protein [Bacteriovoracaceae bacterium]